MSPRGRWYSGAPSQSTQETLQGAAPEGPQHGRALRIGGGGHGREYVVSMGCAMRAHALINGHRVPFTLGRLVLRRRLLLHHSRGWPSAANLRGQRGTRLIARCPGAPHGTPYRAPTGG